MIRATCTMALRELCRNKLRSSLTTLGIVIGVAAVITLVTLGRSASARIESQISSMGSNLLLIAPGKEQRGPVSTQAPPLRKQDAERLERELKGVARVAAASGGPVTVVAGNRNKSTNAIATTREYLDLRGLTVERGRGFDAREDAGARAACIIGSSVARALFEQRSPLGASVRVGSINCPVIGVLASKGGSALGQDQDDVVLLPLTFFQRRFAGTDDVGSIFVGAQASVEPVALKARIETILRRQRRIGEGRPDDFAVHDMKELTRALSGITSALTALLAAIAAVSLVVGGIGIMNIMLVSVTERTREIGVRLALGALGAEVMAQFLAEAVLLSFFGGVLGALFGLSTSGAVASWLDLPFRLHWDVIALALGFAAAVGVLFGYLPARKAARFSPVVALAHE